MFLLIFKKSVLLCNCKLFIYFLLINFNFVHNYVTSPRTKITNSGSWANQKTKDAFTNSSSAPSNFNVNWRLDYYEKDCPSPSLPFLWKIMFNNTVKSYLFGTIHVPYTLVWNKTPNIVKNALQKSDNVYFELDFLNPKSIFEMRDCQYLKNGTLKDILPDNIFNRLFNHLKYVRRMMPKWSYEPNSRQLFKAITRQWQRKEIIWVLIMLNSLTEDNLKFRGTPIMDIYLTQQAKRLNKLIGAIEKVKEQCDPLNNFNLTQAIFALNVTLTQHEGIRHGVIKPTDQQDLLIRYKCGDVNWLRINQNSAQVPYLKESSRVQTSYEKELAKQIDESFRKKLILERNERMSRRIVNLLKSNPEKIFFFAFGVGHFLGSNSIIDFVRSAGYEVNRVSIQDMENVDFDHS